MMINRKADRLNKGSQKKALERLTITCRQPAGLGCRHTGIGRCASGTASGRSSIEEPAHELVFPRIWRLVTAVANAPCADFPGADDFRGFINADVLRQTRAGRLAAPTPRGGTPPTKAPRLSSEKT